MTMREFYTNVIEGMAGNEEMVAIAEKKIAQLDARKSAPRKPSKSVEANNAIREAIKVWFEANPNEGKTIADIAEGVEGLEGASNQRVSALVKPLVDAEFVDKSKDKGKTYYTFHVPVED